MANELNLIELRVSQLEKRLMSSENRNEMDDEGSEERSPAASTSNEKPVLDSLVEINEKLRGLTAGRERFKKVHEKLSEIEPLINNPDEIDELISSPPHPWKVEQILAKETSIRNRAANLEKLTNSAAKVLDCKQMQTCDELKPKLAAIQRAALEQRQGIKALTAETESLISSYNQFIDLIKTQLVAWDAKLRDLEQKRQMNDDE